MSKITVTADAPGITVEQAAGLVSEIQKRLNWTAPFVVDNGQWVAGASVTLGEVTLVDGSDADSVTVKVALSNRSGDYSTDALVKALNGEARGMRLQVTSGGWQGRAETTLGEITLVEATDDAPESDVDAPDTEPSPV